jgi:tetratricopeptide (TPR) repeat protein
MIRLVFLILVFLAQFSPLMAASPVQDQFNEANTAYEKGDLGKAEEIYTALVRQGYGGAALYYNLGNVAYRKGERGKAVLWYRRAKDFSPRDTDIDFNLSLARSHLKDTQSDWVRKLASYFNPNELTLIVSILMWIFLLLFGAMTLNWVKMEIWPGVTLWTTGLFLVMFGSWLGANAYFGFDVSAVVMQGPAEVRNGPGTDYAVGFTVPEGTSVLVLSERPDWMQIGVMDQGLKGWIRASDIEKVKVSSS